MCVSSRWFSYISKEGPKNNRSTEKKTAIAAQYDVIDRNIMAAMLLVTVLINCQFGDCIVCSILPVAFQSQCVYICRSACVCVCVCVRLHVS